MIRGLVVAALTAPLLSGCVIYANEGGERDVSVRFDDGSAPALEAVRSARIENGRLVVRVDSNGCTDAADFAVEVASAEDWTAATLVPLIRTCARPWSPTGSRSAGRWTISAWRRTVRSG